MSIPRPEHPRPDRERAQWFNLNGQWDFSLDEPIYDRVITVPFCYQCAASGIGLGDTYHKTVWYRREIRRPDGWDDKRIRLHFGAADYRAEVYIDDVYIGGHTGGYTPFWFDITDRISDGAAHTLTVRCLDENNPAQPRGKQSWREKPWGCWYTPVTGIWQTVWLEAVGQVYIEDFRFTPDVDNMRAQIDVTLSEHAAGLSLSAGFSLREQPLLTASTSCPARQFSFSITIPADGGPGRGGCLWTPRNPVLFDCELTLSADGIVADSVKTYFGMRKIEVVGSAVMLNGRPLTQKLILDQGYWPDTIYTPPSDDAIRRDVELTKQFGYNGARKHQKIEDPRYYYWADRLGLCVWAELPSAYQFCTDERDSLMRDMREHIARDYNHPSIICWTPLNESWGVREIYGNAQQQSFATALYWAIKADDPTRMVSNNDGWELVASDLCTIHNYAADPDQIDPRWAELEALTSDPHVNGCAVYSKGQHYGGQPVIVSEYAGIAFVKDAKAGAWGYGGAVENEEAFIARLAKITKYFRDLPFVKGWCLTQLSDVFQEVNGLVDMHRQPKIDPERVRKIND